MPKLKKVLITHAMPVNNGDAALVSALYQLLISRGFEVSIASYYYSVVKKKYPGLPIIRELADYYFLRKLPFLKPLFMRLNFWLNSNYRNNDVFIACPGGYVNSYYQLEYALLPLRLAHNYGKKTAIYSQSVGPFDLKDEKLFSAASKYIDNVLVRDEYSMQTMKQINYPGDYFQTKDAAFLLKAVKTDRQKSKKVAVSVREWNFDERNMSHYVDMVSTICFQLIEKGYFIEFLSTCQGVPGYKDDSQTAIKIQKNLAEKFNIQKGVNVDSSYYNLEDLMSKLKEYDFVVGTRLHMCILSWVCSVPALNISYEVKGKECYKYLGIPKYSIDFNENVEQAARICNDFISEVDAIKEEVYTRVDSIRLEGNKDFEKFMDNMGLSDN